MRNKKIKKTTIRHYVLYFLTLTLLSSCGNTISLEVAAPSEEGPSGGVSDIDTSASSSYLSNLTISDSSGSLDFGFDPDIENYAFDVNLATTSLSFSPISANSGCSIEVNSTPVITSVEVPLSFGVNDIEIAVTSADQSNTSTYSLSVNRLIAQQEAYAKASNTQASDIFGYSVSISSDVMVVGANWEDSNATGVDGDDTDNSTANSGAAYVFRYSGDVWAQEAYLKASNTDANDYFGANVAVDGDVIVVGAYEEDSNATGVNGDDTDNSAAGSGAAYVFRYSGGVWAQEAYLKASNTDAGDKFGHCVSVSGDIIAVCALAEDSNATGINGDDSDNSASMSGAVYIFRYSGGVWAQEAYLKASNTNAGDNFGTSVAVDGNVIVVGADDEASNATGVNGDETNNSAGASGAAYVFRYSGGVWAQEAYLKASNTGVGDYFGNSVAISNDVVVVGAISEDSSATGVDGDDTDNSASMSGAAYVFRYSGGVWAQEAYLKASNTEADDYFSTKVAVRGNIIVVGADGEDSNATGINGDENDNSLTNSGAVYIFGYSDGIWAQETYMKASNTGNNWDTFGNSVSMSGNGFIAVGAKGEKSNATGIDGDEYDTSANDSGAAYIFK